MNITLEHILEKLKNPLPGWDGQKILAPDFRAEEIEKLGENIRNARKSAVLILLYKKNGQIYIPFIRRTTYDGIHSGQISLPGGKSENTDPDFQFTALRETHEEIGISPDSIQIIAQLSDLFIPPSNFLVKVFIGISNQIPQFKPDKMEVEDIIEVPINEFFEPNTIKEKVFFRSVDGMEKKAPYFEVSNIEIWGATAMIISELKTIIQQ